MEYKVPVGGKRLKPEEILKRQDIAQRKKDEFQTLYVMNLQEHLALKPFLL